MAEENESIAPIIHEMNYRFDSISILPTDQFILLDVSNPEFFYAFIKPENIIKIIDHHTGYEVYWKEQNVDSNIEFIGSICTIIYEQYVRYHKEELLNTRICRLLAAGILDNTLNLKSSITTARDINAYHALKEIGQIEEDWNIQYFNSCYYNLGNKLGEAIQKDTKIEYVSDILPNVFGQLIVLDKSIVLDQIETVKNVYAQYEEWILNVMCLTDGKSYILFSNDNVKRNLEMLFQTKAQNDYLVLEKFLLRKQIMKQARQADRLLDSDI